MASKGYILSQKDRDTLAGVVRKVNASTQSFGRGNEGASGTANGEVWLEIVDWDGDPHENIYAVDVYAQPYGGHKIEYGTSAVPPAWNRWEFGNNTNTKDGYSIVTSGAVCGDIIGVIALPTNLRYRAVYTYRNDPATTPGFKVLDTWGFCFMERRDPLIKRAT